MKTLLILFTITIPTFLIGQVTLDSASVIPGIGTKINYNTMDNAAVFAGPGDDGANVIWNFSKMTLGDSTELEIEAPNFGGFQADPDNTTLCEQYTGRNGDRIQYKSTPSYLYIMGKRSGFTRTEYGSDSLLKLKYPVAYNDVNNTSYYYSTGGFRPNSRAGSYKVTVDGWGAVLLPFGGLNDILRLKIEESFNDTTTLFGNETVIAYSSTTYEYWQKGTGSYIMSIKYEDDDGTLDTLVTYRKQDQVVISPVDTTKAEDTTSIIEFQPKKILQLFPNPASNNINVLGSDISMDVLIHITSIDGRVHEIMEYNNGEFDISDFPNGIYFLQIEGNGYQPIRFIKQN